jgi:hypothetical protein
MAGKRKISEIRGLKYFKPLVKLLRELHVDGCRRDRAGNRKLHYDQYCLLILLSYFNPLARSVRSLVKTSKLAKVQKKIGCAGSSLGSFSESGRVFDPELIKKVAATLGKQVKPFQDVGKGHVRKKLVAVDGTVIRTLKSITEAAYLADKNGDSHSAWRLHTQFEIDTNVPVRIDVTPGSNSGKTDEKTMLRKNLKPECCYVMDRWYGEFKLFNDIVAAGSSYICRIRDNSDLNAVVEERPVSEAAAQERVLRDFVVDLGPNCKRAARPDHKVRVILVETTPHAKRGGRKGKTAGPASDGIIRIATDMVDVPAEVIAGIFRNRWAIEIFFRMFKHVLGCRHLLSNSPNGIEIQAYCAIIACMLIALWTGRKPTQRTFEMVCWYMMGIATEKELTDHIESLKMQPISKMPE